MKITEECRKCNYWTKNPDHGNYKCYCGDCPAKFKDEIRKKYSRNVKIIIK